MDKVGIEIISPLESNELNLEIDFESMEEKNFEGEEKFLYYEFLIYG